MLHFVFTSPRPLAVTRRFGRSAARATAMLAVTCAALASACARASHAENVSTTLTGVQTLVDDRLTFGRNIPDGGMVSDSAWHTFVRDVVTPRFPAGFTIWRADGQWLDPRGTLVREPLMVFEVFHPRGAPHDSVFARVAAEYRRQFRQDAVLRTTTEARTQMYDGSTRAAMKP
ncbi:MAG: DUF3574 domain-containing protein [bacterium]